MNEPGQALERRAPNTLAVMSDSEINRSWRLAEALAKSGMFPDVQTANHAFAKMLVGHDLGLSPTQALMVVDIVEGKPRLQSVALAAFVKQLPEYDYDVMTHNAEKCRIRFLRVYKEGRDREVEVLGTSEFTIEEAKAAKLGGWPDQGKWAKSGWGKYPKNMLFARAMSNGVKWYAPDAMGGVPVYTEGDEFVRETLTAGSGDGSGPGIDLGPRVEKVLARAERLGHVGLANRQTAEMALGSRSPEAIKDWTDKAEKELDEFEKEHGEEAVEDADVVTPEVRRERANVLREQAKDEDDAQIADGLDAQANEEDRLASEEEGGEQHGDD